MKWSLSLSLSLIILQLLFFNHLVHSMINLFISKIEMIRTLGRKLMLGIIILTITIGLKAIGLKYLKAI
ncbi:unnamed protein product [Brugia pahangi]|uniref:UPF0056 membrane protein n=1 Tax=Brugia pahangi TaxID=6280 RepID=A0A0N4T9M9_BRUPA|nr:unnamed protein product [Brugia pahangi]